MTDGMVEFIKAQMAIDEQIARDAPDGPWEPQTEAWPESPEARVWAESATGREVEVAEANGVLAAAHIARHDPASVLADVESKRRIVEACEYAISHYDDPAWGLAENVLFQLAAAYSSRPGFKLEWRLS